MTTREYIKTRIPQFGYHESAYVHISDIENLLTRKMATPKGGYSKLVRETNANWHSDINEIRIIAEDLFHLQDGITLINGRHGNIPLCRSFIYKYCFDFGIARKSTISKYFKDEHHAKVINGIRAINNILASRYGNKSEKEYWEKFKELCYNRGNKKTESDTETELNVMADLVC